jgi:hypothetical protein
MVFNPDHLKRDIENLNQIIEVPEERKLSLIGFCISADAVIHALHNGVADSANISEILLISPATLFEEGKDNARSRYLPFIQNSEKKVDFADKKLSEYVYKKKFTFFTKRNVRVGKKNEGI